MPTARSPVSSLTQGSPVAIEAGGGGGTTPAPTDAFAPRHIGPSDAEVARMLGVVGFATLEEFTSAVVPGAIRLGRPMRLEGVPEAGWGEHEALGRLREIAGANEVRRSYIGIGYSGTITPPVILRNILENPGWYTQYTPYQAEISQGRLEALLNFQTMVADLTGLPLAGASLLDEATAAGEAMFMCHAIAEGARPAFFVDRACHPQTIGVVRTRAQALGIRVEVGDAGAVGAGAWSAYSGVLVQYPDTNGDVRDFTGLSGAAHAGGALVVAATDLLALTLFRPPGEWGADIAVGSAQRFGVPMGFGGPHAAFISTRIEYARKMPGRIIGVSKDVHGNPAYRMAIQTREQHIRREKATSNICTAQALLAIISGMYAAYHGPGGLAAIARRVRGLTAVLGRSLARGGAGLVL
jgi:glycine dehydrogenase